MKEIAARHSIRKYKAEAVNRDDIKKILEAGILAPSAKNRQPWKFIVVEGDKKVEALDVMEKGLERSREELKEVPGIELLISDAFNTLRIMRQAPVVIFVENSNGKIPFVDININDRITEICDSLSIGAAIQNMLLVATELGYGTLWIANTFYAYQELAKYLGITGQLISAVLLGIPDETPNPRPRKSFDEVVEFR